MLERRALKKRHNKALEEIHIELKQQEMQEITKIVEDIEKYKEDSTRMLLYGGAFQRGRERELTLQSMHSTLIEWVIDIGNHYL